MNPLHQDRYRLSVILPTYNRAEQLGYTLTSLADPTLDRSAFEVIVVDDGSADESFEVAQEFEDLLNLTYAYQPDRGYRVSAARNLGIRLAQGEVCVFLDSGVIARSDCLSRHLACHQMNSQAVAVIGYTYGYTYGWGEHDEPDIVDPGDADETIARLVARNAVFDMRDNIFRKYEDDLDRLSVPWTLFYGGHSSARRTALVRVGMFDENCDGRWGAEDQELGYRLHLDGQRIVLCRDATVFHLPLPADRAERSQQAYENCQYFHRKHQTLESRVFLDAYEQDLGRQGSHQEVVDFHELYLAAKNDRARVGAGIGSES